MVGHGDRGEHGAMHETTDIPPEPSAVGSGPIPPGVGAAPGWPPPGAPPGPPPARRPPLRRSIADRKVAGVAGGLGRYFEVDPLVFRVVLVTLAVFGGSGLLLYAVGWLLVPEDGDDRSEVSRLVNGRPTSKTLGAGLVAIVGLVLVGNFARTGFGFGGFAALVAVAVGGYLFARNDRAGSPAVAQWQPVADVRAGAPGEYGQTSGTAYAGTPPTGPPATAYAGTPAAGPPATGEAPAVPPPPSPYDAPGPGAEPPGPPGPRSPLGRITVSAALLVAGLLVAWNLSTDQDVPGEVVLASCLAVVGLGLVVGAFAGRSRGLVVLGVALMVATTATAVAGTAFRGGFGERTWAPLTADAVRPVYRLGTGDARLDLSRLVLAPGQTVDIEVRQGVGELRVVLPAAGSADVDAEVHAGDLRMPRGRDSGTALHRHYLDPRGGTDADITIDAELGVGHLEVRRATS